MGMYTNSGLVKHAEKAIALKTKYMWGGILRLITNAYINQLSGIPAYKAQYPPARVAELRECVGKGYYGVDCVGLIKSYYWSGKAEGGTGSPKYGAAGYPDVNANYMYQTARVKGKIADMPDVPGLIVYSKTHPHVGIYVGNGYTIESTLGTRGDGVVKKKLDDFWEYWFQCPYIEYMKEQKQKEKAVTLAFKAAIRSVPCLNSLKIGELQAGSRCVIVEGTETTDPKSKYVYVRLAGKDEQWIVKTAVK